MKEKKAREILVNALSRLSEEGEPFSRVAAPWEPQKDENKIIVKMSDLMKFMESVLLELDEK